MIVRFHLSFPAVSLLLHNQTKKNPGFTSDLKIQVQRTAYRKQTGPFSTSCWLLGDEEYSKMSTIGS